MKLAFLVAAHSNFEHLKLLMNVISCSNDDVYLHIDKRARNIPTASELRFPRMMKRQVVHWAGFSQVVVTNRMFKAAFDTSDAEYFILISGGDYPIRPIEELREYLALSGKEHINIRKGFTVNQPSTKLTKFHLEFNRRNSRLLTTRVCRLIERISQDYFRDKELPFDVYTGHNWLALTRDAVQHILSTISRNNIYDRVFRYTYCPDEAYHNTIIGNSVFGDRAAPYLTYTDWSGPEKPAYMAEKHVEIFKRSLQFDTEFGLQDAFFARKFHDGTRNIVKLIDEGLLERRSESGSK
jgi:hypothetical protein